ncbi:MAG: universal stress protein [Pseudomonadota bacterium]
MFKTIAIGIDGSDASLKALRAACEIAQRFGAELHLVHTPQPQTVAFALGAVPGYDVVTTMPSAQEVEEAAQKVVRQGLAVAEEMGQTVSNTYTDRGDPIAQIIACADSCGADLIVTGRRGLGNLGALILGSTSLGISNRATCAVLSVP